MFKLNIVLGVMLGASLGALLRWWLSVKFNAVVEHLYLGTLIANVIACFLMGLYLGYDSDTSAFSSAVRIAFLTGFIGSLSTFSTFIGETHSHFVLQEWLKLMLGFNLQIGLGLLAFHFAKVLGNSWQ
ncbi:MAG: hypothetical protein OFPI_01920 [Osedax symbiont Rs2]|nr:MAG: hypothetical protein OFPI_01920 [Osedax symbiont Rs2]